jgi:hypothetical protein
VKVSLSAMLVSAENFHIFVLIFSSFSLSLPRVLCFAAMHKKKRGKRAIFASQDLGRGWFDLHITNIFLSSFSLLPFAFSREPKCTFSFALPRRKQYDDDDDRRGWARVEEEAAQIGHSERCEARLCASKFLSP